jgi:hypothetical protein
MSKQQLIKDLGGFFKIQNSFDNSFFRKSIQNVQRLNISRSMSKESQGISSGARVGSSKNRLPEGVRFAIDSMKRSSTQFKFKSNSDLLILKEFTSQQAKEEMETLVSFEDQGTRSDLRVVAQEAKAETFTWLQQKT